MEYERASVDLEPTPDAAAVARRFLRDALNEHSDVALRADSEAGYGLIMAASELVTNAMLHARTALQVTIDFKVSGTVRVAVADGNPRMPQPCLAPLGATSGWGFSIIEGLGLAWGADRTGDGKVVWVEAPMP